MLYPFGFFHVKFFHHPIMRSLYLSLFILLLLIQPLYSQPMPKPATNNDYQKDWELVAKKVREGLPKSAQELVEGIYRRAKSEKNVAQQVKALIYTCNTLEADRRGWYS
jgi:hypothetical protein